MHHDGDNQRVVSIWAWTSTRHQRVVPGDNDTGGGNTPLACPPPDGGTAYAEVVGQPLVTDVTVRLLCLHGDSPVMSSGDVSMLRSASAFGWANRPVNQGY